MKDKNSILKSTAKEKLEKAKIAEIRRGMLESSLIPKKEIIRLMQKLASIKCPECEETIRLIIENIETFSLS